MYLMLSLNLQNLVIYGHIRIDHLNIFLYCLYFIRQICKHTDCILKCVRTLYGVFIVSMFSSFSLSNASQCDCGIIAATLIKTIKTWCLKSILNVVSVWRGFLFLWVLWMGYVILLWHFLSLQYNYSADELF